MPYVSLPTYASPRPSQLLHINFGHLFCEIKKPTFFFLLRGIPHVVVKISLQFFEINGVENVHPDSSNGGRKGTILVIVRTYTTEYRNRIETKNRR